MQTVHLHWHLPHHLRNDHSHPPCPPPPHALPPRSCARSRIAFVIRFALTLLPTNLHIPIVSPNPLAPRGPPRFARSIKRASLSLSLFIELLEGQREVFLLHRALNLIVLIFYKLLCNSLCDGVGVVWRELEVVNYALRNEFWGYKGVWARMSEFEGRGRKGVGQ